jgi:hypothetical protein
MNQYWPYDIDENPNERKWRLLEVQVSVLFLDMLESIVSYLVL